MHTGDNDATPSQHDPSATGQAPLPRTFDPEEEDGLGLDGEEQPHTPRHFQDLVKRSTRFVTSVPAAQLLSSIEGIIAADSSPLPYPYRSIKQHTVLHWDDYRLDIKWGGVLVYTVQVFLIQSDRALYMVEFRRCTLDIFSFKRFYEKVRARLARLVKEQHGVFLLDDPSADFATSDFGHELNDVGPQW